MKTLNRILRAAPPAIALVALGLFAVSLTGCKAPVDVSASYDRPGANIMGTVEIDTNAVSIGGDYQAGTTNVSGTVTVGK